MQLATYLLNWIELDGTALVTLAVRSVVLFAIAGIAVGVMRRSSAAQRHFVWCLALCGSLILPLLSNVMPGWRVLPQTLEGRFGTAIKPRSATPEPVAMITAQIPSSVDSAEVPNLRDFPFVAARDLPVDLSEDPSIDAIVPVTDTAPRLHLLTEEPATPASQQATIANWLHGMADHATITALVIWFTGLVIGLTPMIAGFISLRRLYRTSRTLPPHLALQLADLAQEVCPGRALDGVITDQHCLPMTWGFRRPVLLLPAEAVHWSFERRRLVFLHELSHVRRYDYVTQLIGQCARAVYWFNPFAWYALQQLQAEQENACDDRVLQSGIEAAEYAAELLTLTSRIPETEWNTTLALAMGRSERLERRLSQVLNGNVNRLPLPWGKATLVGLLFCIALLFIAISQPRTADAVPPSEVPTKPAGEKPFTKPSPLIQKQNEEETVVSQEPQATHEKSGTDQTNASSLNRETKSEEDNTAAKSETSLLAELLSQIEKMSAVPIESSKLEEGAVKGMLEALDDPHSQLLTSPQIKEIEQVIEGRLAGIGAMLKQDADRVVVIQSLPNSAAWRAGLKSGDVVLTVDGTPTTNVHEAVKLIRGVVGTVLQLELKSEDQPSRVLSLTRGNVTIPVVQGWTLNDAEHWSYWLDEQQGIAYIRIVEFNRTSAHAFRQAMLELSAANVKGLVLDLRDCPGGLFHEMVDIASCFLSDKPIAKIQSRQDLDSPLRTQPEAPYPDVPLTVLINQNTASAAEVLASALQEHDRAVLVGQRTFGKGTIQAFIPLSTGERSIRLTVGLMSTANGRLLQRSPTAKVWGVDPNEGYYVQVTPEELAMRRQKSALRTSQVLASQSWTPEVVTTEAQDTQLAAAELALLGKIQTGQFAITGESLKSMQLPKSSIEELQLEREKLRQRMQEIDAALGL